MKFWRSYGFWNHGRIEILKIRFIQKPTFLLISQEWKHIAKKENHQNVDLFTRYQNRDEIFKIAFGLG